jgi:hypothetical protein
MARSYGSMHSMHVSAITVMERMRGYALYMHRRATRTASLALRASGLPRFPRHGGPSMPPLLCTPPNWPPCCRNRLAAKALLTASLESRQERLFRWRCDILIAATALVAAMPLVHHNPRDFETIRMAIETSPQRFPTLGPLNLVSVLRLDEDYSLCAQIAVRSQKGNGAVLALYGKGRVPIARMRQNDCAAAATCFSRALERAALQDGGQGLRGHRIPWMKAAGALHQVRILHLFQYPPRPAYSNLNSINCRFKSAISASRRSTRWPKPNWK